MKLFLAAAAALTLGGSALAYQADPMVTTVHVDPSMTIQVPATWTAFQAMLGLPPAQWTAEQRALWQVHHASFPSTWTAEQRAAYQQQIAMYHTPWGTSMAMATTDRTVEPSNADPEHDARGIAVISAAAFVPAGFNGVPASAMGGPIEGDDASYPACTATVTDNCIQLYERGVRASLADWNSTHATSMGVGGPIEGEDEIGDNTAEDDGLDIDVEPDGDLDVDGDLDGDGDNDLE